MRTELDALIKGESGGRHGTYRIVRKLEDVPLDAIVHHARVREINLRHPKAFKVLKKILLPMSREDIGRDKSRGEEAALAASEDSTKRDDDTTVGFE